MLKNIVFGNVIKKQKIVDSYTIWFLVCTTFVQILQIEIQLNQMKFSTKNFLPRRQILIIDIGISDIVSILCYSKVPEGRYRKLFGKSIRIKIVNSYTIRYLVCTNLVQIFQIEIQLNQMKCSTKHFLPHRRILIIDIGISDIVLILCYSKVPQGRYRKNSFWPTHQYKNRGLLYNMVSCRFYTYNIHGG